MSIKVGIFETKYGKMACLPNDVEFARSLSSGKLYEEDILDSLREYLKGDGDILDVGAHIGGHSLYFSHYRNPTQKLFCFEPQNVLYEILKANLQMNNIENVEAMNNAAGPYEDTIYLDKDFTKDHYPAWLKVDYQSEHGMNFGGLGVTNDEGGEQVKMIKLDDVLQEKTKKVHFIKIDTEGAENGVVYGLGNTIFRDKPILFIENNKDKKRDAEFLQKLPSLKTFDYIQMLKSIGYKDPIDFPGSNQLFIYQKA